MQHMIRLLFAKLKHSHVAATRLMVCICFDEAITVEGPVPSHMVKKKKKNNQVMFKFCLHLTR